MTLLELFKKQREGMKNEQVAVMRSTFEGSGIPDYPKFLLALGKYRQLKAGIDQLSAEIEKRDPDNAIEEEENPSVESDEDDDVIPEVSQARRRLLKRQPAAWG